MKSVTLATALLLFAATAAFAQQERQQHHRPNRPAPAQPAAPFVPQTLSTGGITTLPPPPSPGPFAARPDTYLPRYNGRSRVVGGGGYVSGPYYDSAAGIAESVAPSPSSTGVAPHYEAPYIASPEPQKSPAPVPEPPRIAVAHGPDTFYVIPGCYAGNHPPNPDRLPEGCDLSKLRTLPIH